MIDIFVDEVQTKDVTIEHAKRDYELATGILKNTDALGEDFVIDQGIRAELAMKDFLKYSSEGMEY